MTVLYILMLFGATIRLTRLVTIDVILETPRAWIERHAPEKLQYLIRCPWCASWWVGLIVFVIGYYVAETPVMVIASALTASLLAGYAAMIEGFIENLIELSSLDDDDEVEDIVEGKVEADE